MKPRRTVLAVFGCLLLATAHAQERPVTPKEIEDTWIGKSLVGTTPNGAPALVKLQADGSAAVSAGSTNDTGTWRISDQGYCTTWKTIRAGQERCFTVRRDGVKMTVFNPDGSVSGYFTEIR
jgi:hypothetical protein